MKRLRILKLACLAAVMTTMFSCRIEPPLNLPTENVVVELPIVIQELQIVWDIDISWTAKWVYEWDEEDSLNWGSLRYPEPKSFDVRRYFIGEYPNAPRTWEERDWFIIYEPRFKRRFNFGYHDILVWSRIESEDGTQVLVINEDDIENVTGTTTTRSVRMYTPKMAAASQVKMYNQPEIFYSALEKNVHITNNIEDYDYYDEVENVWVKRLDATLNPLVYIYLVQVILHNNKGRIVKASDLCAIDGLAFYTSITSYKVTLTDLVPEKITGSPFTIEKQEGVVLTPAVEGNTSATITQPGTNTEFDTMGDVVIDFNPTPAATWSNYTKSNENLCFHVKDYPSLPTSNASLVALPTIYYAVPQSGSTCGFTVHVSFKMESAPNITGTSDVIQLYDARVWVPASACKWEAGKAYTYVFTINDNCSGTTDPQRKDPKDSSKPYIDPSDPRVIATGELHPIQFETVLVDQYDEIYNGIYPVGGATVTEKVGDGNMYAYTTMPYAIIPSNVEGYTFLEGPFDVFDKDVTYDPTTHKFTVSYGTDPNTISINFPAQTFTEYDVSGKNNYAYFYLFTSNSKSAVKFTATQNESTWTVTSENIATYNGQAYSIYIKNLHENINITANADSPISDAGHEITEATGTLSIVQVNNTAISGTEHTIDYITCTISGKTVTISGTPTKVGDYNFRIKDSGTGQYVNVYVYVNDVVGFNSYTVIPGDAYQYTNNATYLLHNVDGYLATTEFYEDADLTNWSYADGTFTYSDGSITMSFNETNTGEVYFWTETGRAKTLSYNGSCVWSDVADHTGKAYAIYKKKP